MQNHKQKIDICPGCGQPTLNIKIDGVCRNCYKSKQRRNKLAARTARRKTRRHNLDQRIRAALDRRSR